MRFMPIFLSLLTLPSNAWASNKEADAPPQTYASQRAPSLYWNDAVSLRMVSSALPFPLAPFIERRPILEEIAKATGNRAEFMIHHAFPMSRVPSHLLEEGLKEGWFKDRLQQNPFTVASRHYYQVEASLEGERLDLSNQGLAFLPPYLWTLTQLGVLYLGHNNLTSLPDSIGDLLQLEELSLEGNRFTTLPRTCENLINLQELKLSPHQWKDPQTQEVYKALQAKQKAAGKKPVKVMVFKGW